MGNVFNFFGEDLAFYLSRLEIERIKKQNSKKPKRNCKKEYQLRKIKKGMNETLPHSAIMPVRVRRSNVTYHEYKIEPTYINFRGSDIDEPKVCNVFGCARELSLEEQRFGDKCVSHNS